MLLPKTHRLVKMEIPFIPVVGYVNRSVVANPPVSATLYHYPPTETNPKFWVTDQTLLSWMLASNVLLFADETQDFPVARYSVAMEIQRMFGKHDAANITDEDFDASEKVADAAYRVIQDLGTLKMDSFFNVLRETIRDCVFTSSLQRKYLLVLHETSSRHHVYMTMSIRLFSEDRVVEHEYIQQCVRSLVEFPLFGVGVPMPKHLSMLMHQTSLRFIRELHPRINALLVKPLYTMYNIFVREKFAPFLTEEDFDQPTLEITGAEYVRLRDGIHAETRVTEGQRIGSCISCTVRRVTKECTLCKAPSVCDTLKCARIAARVHICDL